MGRREPGFLVGFSVTIKTGRMFSSRNQQTGVKKRTFSSGHYEMMELLQTNVRRKIMKLLVQD